MQSENINEMSAALVKAQSQIEGAKKDSENPFYKSKYADLNSVIAAVKKPLNNNGFRFSWKSHIEGDNHSTECILTYKDGQEVSSGKMPLFFHKKDPQEYGKAQTYIKRYSLQAVTGLNVEDDDDGNSLIQPCREHIEFMNIFRSVSPEGQLQLKKDLAHISNAKKSPGDRNFWRNALNEIKQATN